MYPFAEFAIRIGAAAAPSHRKKRKRRAIRFTARGANLCRVELNYGVGFFSEAHAFFKLKLNVFADFQLC
jgi:hypothetical protein